MCWRRLRKNLASGIVASCAAASCLGSLGSVAALPAAPAEQLLHWCGELLDDDLEYRCNRVVIRYDGECPEYTPRCHKFREKEQVTELVDAEEGEEVIGKFRAYLQDLQVKLWVERGLRPLYPRSAWKQLKGDPKLVGEPTPAELLAEVPGCDVVQCHRLLDIANCYLKRGQESTASDLAPDDPSLAEHCKKALRCSRPCSAGLMTCNARARESFASAALPLDLKKVGKSLVGSGTEGKVFLDVEKQFARLMRLARLGDLQAVLAGHSHETMLRLLHLKAECELARVSVFSHDGFTGDCRSAGSEKPRSWMRPPGR